MRFLVSFSMSGVRGGEISLALFDEEFNVITYMAENETMTDGNQGTTIVNDKIYTVCLNKLYEMNMNFKILRVKKYEFSGAHGICYDDGLLYIVMTFSNKVIAVDINTLNIVEEYSIDHDDREERGDNGPHINSIYVDKCSRIITVHNHNNEGYAYNVTNDAGVYTIARGLTQPHDLKLVPNGYVVNNSRQHQFLYCGVPIETSYSIECPGYTRGLGITKNNFYVGCTDRDTLIKQVVRIDRNMKMITGTFELPNDVDQLLFCPEIYSIVPCE